MNLYKECIKVYRKYKMKKLRKLKRCLWLCGAKPKQWEYLYQGGSWKAFHVVDDMDIIAEIEDGFKKPYLEFRISYFQIGRGNRDIYGRDWSSVKRHIGERLVENDR